MDGDYIREPEKNRKIFLFWKNKLFLIIFVNNKIHVVECVTDSLQYLKYFSDTMICGGMKVMSLKER